MPSDYKKYVYGTIVLFNLQIRNQEFFFVLSRGYWYVI